MPKAPAFQFYPADWLKDPGLAMASWASQGIWIRVLCHMWEAPNRGELTGPIGGFCRMIGCTETEFEAFYAEAEALKFGDVSRDCHGAVTVRNRRMIKDEKTRKDWRIRQGRHRSCPEPEDKSRVNPADVQAMSPGSSSSTSVIEDPSDLPSPSVDLKDSRNRSLFPDQEKGISIHKGKRNHVLPRPWDLTIERAEVARRYGVDPLRTHEKFCAWWWGNGKTKLNWDQTWVTWCIGENEKMAAAKARERPETAFEVNRRLRQEMGGRQA